MSSGQKVALSFLAALVCFAGFCFFAQTNLLSTIETKFYAQSKIAQRQEQLDKLSESCNNYISNILTKIETDSSAYLKESAVKTYASQNPSEKDEVSRRNLTSALFDTLDALDGIRLIEGNGRNVHFSTYDTDVLKVDGLVKQYKNYPDLKEELGELEADAVLTAPNNPKHKIIFDDKQNRIIISFPFYITEQTTFGSLVCYFNIYDLVQNLVNTDLLPLGESFDLLMGEDGLGYGFACGIPGDGKSDFTKAIINSWKISSGKADRKKGVENLISQSNGTNWVLLNGSDKSYFNVGWVFKANVFELPKELIYLIYISVFITLLLIFLLLFNLKKDYLIKIKQRIKKVQLGIIREYLENKQQIEWDQIARQLEYRKEELSLEIKKSVGGKNKKYEKIIDVYLEQSWSEIINIINSQNNNQKSGLSGASIEEIRRVMEEVLKTANLNVSVVSGAAASIKPVEVEEVEPVEDLGDIEEIDEVEEAESVEELDDIEEIDEIEEVEAADDVEEIEEVEEVEAVEEVDEIEEVEDAEAADDVEEIEEVEEVEAADDVDEIEEVEEAEAADNVDEIEEVEEAEELDDIEIEKTVDVDITEEFGELSEVGDLEELEDGDVSLENSAITKAEPEYHYVESNRTFVSSSSDDFATCDTIFAEDLCIGTHYTPEYNALAPDFSFVVYTPDFTPENDFDMELAAADELIPEEGKFFSMTGFAENDLPVSELEEIDDNPAIVEEKGVYSISENIECSKLELNPEFKELVDSVLFR